MCIKIKGLIPCVSDPLKSVIIRLVKTFKQRGFCGKKKESRANKTCSYSKKTRRYWECLQKVLGVLAEACTLKYLTMLPEQTVESKSSARADTKLLCLKQQKIYSCAKKSLSDAAMHRYNCVIGCVRHCVIVNQAIVNLFCR